MAEQSDMGDITTIRWNELPDHLKEKILSRLPFESLLRFRRVSKGWKSLLTSKAFLRQWSFESPQNPWLMICSPSTHMCLVYSFDLQSWQTLSLSSLLQKHCCITYKGSTSGFLLVDLFSDWNPLSRTFRNLPHIPNAAVGYEIMAHGIAGGDGDEGFKVIVLGKSSRNTVDLQLYDSAVGSWRPIPVFMPEDLLVCQCDDEMVFCAGKFFCSTVERSGIRKILVFDVEGAGNCTVLPMPNDSHLYWWLLTCGGSVLVAGAREEDVMIWQYCCPTWREVARMDRINASRLLDELERWDWSRVECVAVGNNVCFRKRWGLDLKVLAYSTTMRSWTWLPNCPTAFRHGIHGRLKGLPVQPRPELYK